MEIQKENQQRDKQINELSEVAIIITNRVSALEEQIDRLWNRIEQENSITTDIIEKLRGRVTALELESRGI